MRMKKIVALALALMLALSMAACGTKDTSWVAKAGDDVIAPGIYLTFLMTGVNDASTKAADPEKPLEGEIDGVPADQYVVEYAKREVTKYLGAAAQYRALGLSMTEEDIAQYEDYANYIYEMGSDYYEMAGISKDSVLAINENSMMTAMIFEELYGAGGELAMSDEEYDEAFADLYYRSYYYVFPKMDFTTGNPLSQEEVDKAQAQAEEFYNRAKAGESFVDLLYEQQLANTEEGQEPPVRYEDELYEYLFTKDDANLPPAFLYGLSEAAPGDIFKLEDEYYYYVVQKLDPKGTPQETKDRYRTSVTQQVKMDEFMTKLEQWGNELDIQYNEDALKVYTPEKVKKDADAYYDSLNSSAASSSSVSSSSEAASSTGEDSSSEAASSSSADASSEAVSSESGSTAG